MKRLPALTAVCSLSLLGAVCATAAAEAPGANEPQVQQVLAVAKEVQAQQAAIADNQAKIEAKLATIAESVRVARIWATRGGGRK
jgi:hypothetical protein